MSGEIIEGKSGTGSRPIVGRATEDLNVTLLAWPNGHEIASHVNSEVDVVTVVISGKGTVTLDGETHPLEVGCIAIIPKGAERSILSQSDDFRYLNIHKRRRLMPNMTRPV